MVRTEGADKRGTARFLAYGVNGLGVALMIVVFAHTGGMLVGAEAGVAGGTAVLAQKLLEAVFGDQAVRTLAERARQRPARRGPTSSARRRAPPLHRPARLAGDRPGGAPTGCAAAARRVDDLRFAAAGRGPTPLRASRLVPSTDGEHRGRP